MKVLTRTTAQGNEYWDTELKKSLFVPAGQEPSFEVIKNPKSMLGEEDLLPANESDEIYLDDMTVKELRAYAKESNVVIPPDVTKKDDIIKMLVDDE